MKCFVFFKKFYLGQNSHPVGYRCGQIIFLLITQSCPCILRPHPFGVLGEGLSQQAGLMLDWQAVLRKKIEKYWVSIYMPLGQSFLRYRLTMCKYSPQPAPIREKWSNSVLTASLFEISLEEWPGLGQHLLVAQGRLQASFSLKPPALFFLLHSWTI